MKTFLKQLRLVQSIVRTTYIDCNELVIYLYVDYNVAKMIYFFVVKLC